MHIMERLNSPDVHQSMRGYFAHEIHERMMLDERIWLITADLGWGMWDKVRKEFPERAINVGAAEQAGVGISVGLAESGKIPLFYSITTFGIYRPFEIIRNYVNHEKIPVKLVMSGRDRDYAHDGFSHWSEDAKEIITTAFPNIKQYWPENKEEIPHMMDEFLYSDEPAFVSLRR